MFAVKTINVLYPPFFWDNLHNIREIMKIISILFLYYSKTKYYIDVIFSGIDVAIQRSLLFLESRLTVSASGAPTAPSQYRVRYHWGTIWCKWPNGLVEVLVVSMPRMRLTSKTALRRYWCGADVIWIPSLRPLPQVNLLSGIEEGLYFPYTEKSYKGCLQCTERI